jgi:hypothetical protein
MSKRTEVDGHQDAACPDAQADLTCESCGELMSYLGSVPRKLAHEAIRIFRCCHCDNVVSDEC